MRVDLKNGCLSNFYTEQPIFHFPPLSSFLCLKTPKPERLATPNLRKHHVYAGIEYAHLPISSVP